MRFSFFIIIPALWFKPLFGAFDYPAFSARNAALANSYLAATYVQDAFVLNPALLVNTTSLYAALNYSSLFNMNELRYANGILGTSFKSIGIGLSVEDFGSSLYKEDKLSLAFSKLFYNNALAIGFSLHAYFISVENYGSSNTIGLTLGVRYRLLESLHLAGVVENVNQPALNSYREEIPQRIQLGVQYQPVDQLVTHLKVQKDSWFSPEVSFAAEYRVFDSLEFFSGYSTLATTPSFGVLLNIFRVEVSYAMQYNFDLGSTHFIGIAFNSQS
jgi:hypothetical protein